VSRAYHLGRRQASVDRTGQSILAAARELVSEGSAASVGAIARRAGVSRITVYNRFGSRARVLQSLAPPLEPAEPAEPDPREALRQHFLRACTTWAAEPALFRHLPGAAASDSPIERRLAELLLAADALRPGCSIREAEDVIAALAAFPVFDRLHKDGRRSPAAVAEVLMRLAGGILT
jgi:AcrR family transcriptional regulator